MSAAELPFHTAAFGGFQKQDVLNYIEAANQEHLERLAALKQELDEAHRANAELEEQRLQNELLLQALSEQTEQLRQQAEQTDLGTRALKEELAVAQARLTEAEEQLAAAQAQSARWEPAARAYESLKERTAGIELEAHHRAQAIRSQAQAQADQIRAETGQWLQSVQHSYRQVRADLASTVAGASGELERVCRALAELNDEFARQNDAFQEIISVHQNEAAPKPMEAGA